MKRIFILSLLSLFTLLSCASETRAEELEIFNVKFEIDSACKLLATTKNQKAKNIQLSISGESCQFIKFADTNVVHIERVTNAYMFLVESAVKEGDSCMSQYTAVVVKNNGSVEASKSKKRSGTCGIDRERKVFDYFAYKMNLLK